MEIDPAYERFWGEPLDLRNSAGSQYRIAPIRQTFGPDGVVAMPRLSALWGSVKAAAMVHILDLPDRAAQIRTRQGRPGDA
jgi:hypothetical protein